MDEDVNTQDSKSQRIPPPTAKVKSIDFGMMRTDDVLRMSHVEVVNHQLYGEARDPRNPTIRQPTKSGCLDTRMGAASKMGQCDTCSKPLSQCVGHFGHIKLEMPCFHIGYFKECHKILQMICKNCSRVLFKDKKMDKDLVPWPEFRMKFIRRMKGAAKQTRKAIFKQIFEEAKKVRECQHCQAHNGPVKKMTGVFKLYHDLSGKEMEDERQAFMDDLENAAKLNPQLKEFISRAQQELNPLDVLTIFRRIPNEDLPLLNFAKGNGRPEDLLYTHLAVPPVCIRPSVPQGPLGSNEDDLTVKLGDLVYINNAIQSGEKKGWAPANLSENWEFLQQQLAMYVNSDMPGLPMMARPSKPIRGITQRLRGKTGRFRGNLSGKRVDFSSRSVISPDPNLRIDQVGVPIYISMNLTFPEHVNKHNIKMLRQAILNGPDKHPGANFVELESGLKLFLKYAKRDKIALNLKEGDIVERHLIDGDVVLFNRQPSLHRVSIMSHRVKVVPNRTFCFNECVCTPYNADFDGDEMNMHVPQTYEARAEALLLMSSIQNIITPRHGSPLITATQDFLSAAYLLTQKDVFYDRTTFARICAYINDADEHVIIPPPCIMKPVRMWSGKQLINILLRPNRDPKWPLINLELKAKNFEDTDPSHMCPRDGYVVIRNSEHLAGNLCKNTLGGSKKGLFYATIRDYSPEHAAVIMNRLAKLCARWLGNRGFSIGIDDVTPSARLLSRKADLIKKGFSVVTDSITKFQKGELEAKPGCSEEQTVEAICLGTLSKIRQDAGLICLSELDYHNNSPLIMAVCGSKGSNINISQMVSCVGQQAVGGKRIAEGFHDRTLPHFEFFSRDPDARGFVENSFYSGMTAPEFFFHTMGGREGLVDTAVKTAETGYMQRRLMKTLEDLCVHYDDTVRTAEGNIVQFTYGDDGLDPMWMADGVKPIKFEALLDHIQSMSHHERFEDQKDVFEAHEVGQDDRPLLPDEIWEQYTAYRGLDHVGKKFRGDVDAYIQSLMVRTEKERAFFCSTMEGGETTTGKGKTTRGRRGKQTSSLSPASYHSLMSSVSKNQLTKFLSECRRRYQGACVEPGTAVGAIGGTSLGEPTTQMTLKTFHFAGVASMNVTLGVPRIKEIIDASKSISSPIVTAWLHCDNDIKSARIVKGRIETTRLGEISESIEEMISPTSCCVVVKLDEETIKALQLSIDAHTVYDALLHSKLKVGSREVEVLDELTLRVVPSDLQKENLLYNLAMLKTELPKVVVEGISGVGRAVINVADESSDGTKIYNLLVEGSDLLSVMTTTGVRSTEATCNHIFEVQRVLGIEAARSTIVSQILETMDAHSLTVDTRHVQLLADTMTYRGEILGVTRHGVSKMKDSVLMLASFEQTTDHLFEAAIRGTKDPIKGVSGCIIMGTNIPVGTGLFKLLHKVDESAEQYSMKKNAKRQFLL